LPCNCTWLQVRGVLKGDILRKPILIGVVALAVILVTFLGCTESNQPSTDIMAGSSFIANIIGEVADNEVEARALIPPGVCPGHYDVKPSDIEALANSKALIIHNYQQNYQNILGAIDAAQNADLAIRVINMTGNWMVPSVQAEGVGKIAQVLGEIYPENADYYQENATEREQAILAYGAAVEDRLQDAEVNGVKVICAEMQAGFVSWAGFDIVATFGRPEDLTPAQVADLIDEAQGAGAALIIDNLQSGSTTLGASLEQDVAAIPVTISNFPGGLENTETWEQAIDKNVDLLLAALDEWEEQYG
jgi:zinc transport system substrate-binding protein